MPRLESLVSASSVPMRRDAEAEPHAVDHRMAHRRQVDLGHHLPGVGAEAPADADQHLVDLAHAAGDVERHREEAGDRPHRHLRAGADAEPHDHDREEDDLGRRPEIIEQRLERPLHQLAAAEHDADRDARSGRRSRARCRSRRRSCRGANRRACRMSVRYPGKSGTARGRSALPIATARARRRGRAGRRRRAPSQAASTVTMMTMRSAVTGCIAGRRGFPPASVNRPVSAIAPAFPSRRRRTR